MNQQAMEAVEYTMDKAMAGVITPTPKTRTERVLEECGVEVL
jgi:hypothetical protein